MRTMTRRDNLVLWAARLEMIGYRRYDEGYSVQEDSYSDLIHNIKPMRYSFRCWDIERLSVAKLTVVSYIKGV
jgi:hypothetical protein